MTPLRRYGRNFLQSVNGMFGLQPPSHGLTRWDSHNELKKCKYSIRSFIRCNFARKTDL